MLIDAGVGVRLLKRHFGEYGLSLLSVHNILVTHDHADHVKSVGSLSGSLNVPVYTTKEVHDGIQRNWYVKRKIENSNIRYVEKNKSQTVGSFTVTPFGVPHDSSDNVGYVIETEGVVFTLITDCGHITEEMRPIIMRTNYLVIEANHDPEMLKNGPYPQFLKNRISSGTGHLSNNDCAETLAECATPELRHVWLCHLSEKNNDPEYARKTVEAILRDRGIIAGKDFKLDVLPRKKPMGIFDLD